MRGFNAADDAKGNDKGFLPSKRTRDTSRQQVLFSSKDIDKETNCRQYFPSPNLTGPQTLRKNYNLNPESFFQMEFEIPYTWNGASSFAFTGNFQDIQKDPRYKKGYDFIPHLSPLTTVLFRNFTFHSENRENIFDFLVKNNKFIHEIRLYECNIIGKVLFNCGYLNNIILVEIVMNKV